MAFCFHRACTLPTLVLIIAKALNDVFEVLEVGIEEILAENSGFRLPFATDTYSSVPSVVPPVIFMVWLVLKYMLLSNHQLIMRLTVCIFSSLLFLPLNLHVMLIWGFLIFFSCWQETTLPLNYCCSKPS
jgi:hypothetical protein